MEFYALFEEWPTESLVGFRDLPGCLNEQLPEATPPVSEEELPMKFLENGMIYESFLRGLTPEQRAHVYIHGEARWTAAKTLRRMTEHLRDHYPWMQTIAQQFCTSE
jgi:hypothetical protein